MQRLRPRAWILPALIVVMIGAYFLPPIHSRVAWRLDSLRTQVIYVFNPPDELVFQPTQQVDVTAIHATTWAQYMSTLTPQPSATPRAGPSFTPTVKPTPLPAKVDLEGNKYYVNQCERWNYCGPANLTMALNYWGWGGNRDDVAKVIKPGSPDLNLDFIQRGEPDKNVMPYEMADFVNEQTDVRALYRYGGDNNLLKQLLAAGYPVIIEKGYFEFDFSGKFGWFGHYSFVTGYDDAQAKFIWQDSYPPPRPCKGNGRNVYIPYAQFTEGWRAFDYVFIVLYPPEREQEVLNLLGPWFDVRWAAQHALETAAAENDNLSGIDLFFSWFNQGTSHVALQQYADAALAYDQAFAVYGSLGQDDTDRPYRMMWYQTGPYFAYFYTGRYQDVINLANITVHDPAEDQERTLEESLLWRGRAYAMLGNRQAAENDYRAALAIHVNWLPAVEALQELGVQP